MTSTREAAVELGRMLQKELRLFRGVTSDCPFEDSFQFYRLRTKRSTGDIRTSGTRSRDGSDNCSNSSVEVNSSSRNDKASTEGHSGARRMVLSDKLEAFKRVVQVKDNFYRRRKYKNTFVGCDAVDALVFNGIAETRKEAIQLGRALAREFGLFQHVCDDHAFCDDFLFYRYRIDDDMSFGTNYNLSISDGASLGISQNSGRSTLAEKAEQFKNSLDIRDRKYHLKTYRSCFIGSETVDALVLSGISKTREEALQFGRSLEQELRLFKHVTGDHPFCDDYFFYRLRDHHHFCASTRSSHGSHAESRGSDLSGKIDPFVRCINPLVRDRKYHMKTYKSVFVGQGG